MTDEKVYVAFGDRNVVATTNDKEVRMSDEKIIEMMVRGALEITARPEWWSNPDMRIAIRAALAALEKAGYTVVPVKPTLEMRKVCSFETAEIEWPAMLAAASNPPKD